MAVFASLPGSACSGVDDQSGWSDGPITSQTPAATARSPASQPRIRLGTSINRPAAAMAMPGSS